MTWKDRLRSAQHPNPYESDPVRLTPEPVFPPPGPWEPLNRAAAEAKWAADAEILERYADSPLYARTALDLGDPLPDYEREIEPFVMRRWAELDGPTFRAEVRA